jgi:hypothetical protein
VDTRYRCSEFPVRINILSNSVAGLNANVNAETVSTVGVEILFVRDTQFVTTNFSLF